MKLGELIKSYRESHGLSMSQFAKKAGLSKMYLSMLEKNYNPSTGKEILPSTTTFQKCAQAMGVTIDQLLSKLDNDQLIHVITVPESEIIQTVTKYHNLRSQFMCDADKVNVKTDVITKPGFSFIIKDESMILSRIRKGDTIYAHSEYAPVNDGDVLVVVLPYTNEYTLRRAYVNDNKLILRPDNPDYSANTFTEDNIDSLLILGKAIKCLFTIK